jgi:hypothetical protein
MQVDQEMLFEIILVRFPHIPRIQASANRPRLPTTSTLRLCSTSAARPSPT